MKILIIGGATQDIFIDYDNQETALLCLAHEVKKFLLLPEGIKIELDAVAYLTGGGATNTAISFIRQGFTASVFFKTGIDPAAQMIRHYLRSEGVQVLQCPHNQTIPTGVSFILPCPSGDRTILAYRGANTTVEEQELPYDAIRMAEHLYITSLSGPTARLLPIIASHAHHHNIPVATNPGTSQLQAGAQHLQESLPYLDILILNCREACILMNSLMDSNEVTHEQPASRELTNNKHLSNLLQTPIRYQALNFKLQDFFTTILQRGPRIAVVTNGAEGVYVGYNDRIYFHRSLPVDVVCTVGAGDAFGSCFVANVLAGTHIEEAMVRGIINAASVISFQGAKQGLLSTQELERRSADLGTGEVQCHSFLSER